MSVVLYTVHVVGYTFIIMFILVFYCQINNLSIVHDLIDIYVLENLINKMHYVLAKNAKISNICSFEVLYMYRINRYR